MPTVINLPRAVRIKGPSDPILARLWALAVSKFAAQQGHPPEAAGEWRMVNTDYRRLMDKAGGSLGQVIAQRCAEAPGGD